MKFKELFTEGGGGPRGNFSLGEPYISYDEYGKVIDSYNNNVLMQLAKIKKSLRGKFDPRMYDSRSGAAGETFELVLWQSKGAKPNRVVLKLYPNYGSTWDLSIQFATFVSGGIETYAQTSISKSLGSNYKNLTPAKVQDALKELVNSAKYDERIAKYPGNITQLKKYKD